MHRGGVAPIPIKKTTLARVKGYKTIIGTVGSLKKQVDALTRKYGNIQFRIGITQVTYIDAFGGNAYEGKKSK